MKTTKIWRLTFAIFFFFVPDEAYFLALKELYGKVIVHVALIYEFTFTKVRVFPELQ